MRQGRIMPQSERKHQGRWTVYQQRRGRLTQQKKRTFVKNGEKDEYRRRDSSTELVSAPQPGLAAPGLGPGPGPSSGQIYGAQGHRPDGHHALHGVLREQQQNAQ